MTYLVTEGCINCKHGDCIPVCPVDAFHQGPNFVSINPDVCIDCGICVQECPEDAIFDEHVLNASERAYWLDVNTRTSKVWPIVTQKVGPMPDYETWSSVKNKRELLDES